MPLSFADRILNLIYPKKCVFCGELLRDGGKYACEECMAQIPHGGIVRYAEAGQYWKCAAAPFCYDGAARHALRRYKFSPSPHIAAAFAHFMLPVIFEKQLHNVDYVTFVPGNGGLFHSRGYNQAELLARRLWKQSEGRLPKPCRLIAKVRKIQHQYSVSGAERAQNVKNAFAAARDKDLKGCRILLIDDILTSGATASECAECLIRLGAREVNVAAAAIPGFKRTAQ